MKPSRRGDLEIDEGTTIAGSSARQQAFGSHQKLAARKKHSVEPVNHNMSASIPDHVDSLPNVRGALNPKKTNMY